MKLHIKKKKDHVWEDIDLNELVGRRLIDYVVDEWDPVSIAVFDENDKVRLVVSNSKEVGKFYKDTDIFFMLASDMQSLLDGEACNPLVVEVFNGATLFEVRKPEEVV